MDDYIARYPKNVQEILQKIRKIAHEEVTDGTETISYGVPTIKRNGNYVVYFAAFKKHISIYPITSELEKSIKELEQYRTGKGTMQFPLDKPIPYDLIRKIVQVLQKEHMERSEKKKR